MAIQTVSPLALQRALLDARRHGGPSDYYGLGAALGQFGNAYGDLAHNVVSANDAIRSNEITNAQLNSGYYPLNQELVNTNLRGRLYDAQQQMAVKQAVEEAHQIAAQQGLQAGTPQYQLFMRNYLSQHGPYNAAMGAVPAADKAVTEIQNRGFAQAYVKNAVENEIAKRLAAEYVARNGADQSMSPEAKQALAKDALDYAKKHLDEQGVEVKIGADGTISATDGGQTIPIPPAIVAAGLMAMGNKVPADVVTLMSKEYRTALDEARANQLAAQGVGPKGQVAKAPTKAAPEIDPNATKLYNNIMTQLGKPDLPDSTRTELMNDLAILRQRIGLVTPTATKPNLNSFITNAGGATAAAPGVPTEDQLSNPYGYMPEEGPDTSAFYTTMPPDVYGQAAPPVPTQPSLMNRAMQLAPTLAPTAATGE